jgi:hypothetical protein
VISKNLVFLSYGSSSEYFRAIYCILSLSAWTGINFQRFRLVIYTDNPDFFKTYLSGFNITYISLSPDMLDDMLAGTGFIHRRKVAVINMTFRDFPEQDLIFIDSDTFFVDEPKPFIDEIHDQISFLHKEEYHLDKGLELFSSFGQGHYPHAFIEFITDREFMVNDQSMVFTTNDSSWNSGIVGLSKNFSKYMTDVFKLTDLFYAHSKWFVSEQMAFSLILQRTTTIIPADSFVTHYWGARQKLVVDKVISKLISTSKAADLSNHEFLRSSSTKMQHIVECDLIDEQIEIAFKQRNFVYAAKKAVQLLILKVFKITIRA